MNAQELWNKYKKINPSIGDDIDAWQFGVEADLLAQLVLEGTKTATASAYDVVLDSQDQAVCIIQIKKVSVVPFNQVSAEHAFKEGEGDRTLAYWRDVHENFFKPYYNEYGLTFNGDSQIVLEEFEVVYPTL